MPEGIQNPVSQEKSEVREVNMQGGTGQNHGQPQEEFVFIREKIKEKPMNKKKIVFRFFLNLLMAVIFGCIACVAFFAAKPYVAPWFEEEEQTVPVALPGTEEQESEKEETADTPITPIEPQPTEEEQEPVVNVVEKVQLELKDYAALYSKMNGVVDQAQKFIVTVTGVNSDVDWFNNTYESEGQATGIIVGNNKQELIILTEKNVIENVEEIRVTFHDGTRAVALPKKYDGNSGLATLGISLENIEESTLNTVIEADVANSNSLSKGQPIIAVGSPLGQPDSIAYGNITTLKSASSTVDSSYKLIKTDVLGSLNGSGVLLNLEGKVIGIIAQRFCNDTDNITVTALAISDIRGVIDRLASNKAIAYFGVKGKEVTKADLEEYNLPKGIGIMEVVMDSPAMQAGIQSGDIITKIGIKDIETVSEFQEELINCEPEQLITITVMRKGKEDYKEMSFDVTLSVVQ